jgi:hypothetical protein
VQKSGLKNTQVVLNGVTPGGEYKFASVARAQAQVQVQAQAGPSWGYFGPSPSAGYYYGSQGSYRPSGYYSRW